MISLSVLLIALAILFVSKGVVIVQQAEVVIIERLGKFDRVLQSGFNFIIPVIVIAILELISSLLSLKFIKIRKFLEGKISFIIYKGEIDFKTMNKNRYNILENGGTKILL